MKDSPFPQCLLAATVLVLNLLQPSESHAQNRAGIEDEAVAWLQQFIRTDTVNPPGNEYRAVEFYSGASPFRVGSLALSP